MKPNNRFINVILSCYAVFFILILILGVCSIFVSFIVNLIWNKYFVCFVLLLSGIVRLIELVTNYHNVLTNETQEAKENREYKKWLKENALANQPKRRYLPVGMVC